jgi:ABC-type molybdate transport system substrate-binding protein
VSVFAAGSLRGALSGIAREWEARNPGARVRFTFGASGLLKDRLLGGERADVFASANMEHPQALRPAGLADDVQRFARNAMCVIARPGMDVAPANLVQRMLDPAVKLGTSTPGADPSGDYAREVFRRIEQAGTPGAFDALSRKALQLTGGPQSPPPPADRTVYAVLVEHGQADLFLTYCTNAAQALREEPALQSVKVPPSIDVAANYGVATLKATPPAAHSFVEYLGSPQGQAVLGRFGFSVG